MAGKSQLEDAVETAHDIYQSRRERLGSALAKALDNPYIPRAAHTLKTVGTIGLEAIAYTAYNFLSMYAIPTRMRHMREEEDLEARRIMQAFYQIERKPDETKARPREENLRQYLLSIGTVPVAVAGFLELPHILPQEYASMPSIIFFASNSASLLYEIGRAAAYKIITHNS